MNINKSKTSKGKVNKTKKEKFEQKNMFGNESNFVSSPCRKLSTFRDTSNDTSKDDGCRSLLCDASGIIIAEMIYRCTVCNAVHEFIGDAKQHYHEKHLSNSAGVSFNNFGNLLNNSNSANPYENVDFEDYNYDESAISSVDDQIGDKDQMIELMNTLNQIKDLNNNNFNLYKKDLNLSFDEGFFSNNSSIRTTFEAPTTSYRTTESCTRSGFITCPVCSSNRFYTTLQRRYGQFTCVACYRFFKEFFINPQVYSCPTLSSCSLNVKQKCKACWIYACMHVYTVDSKRNSVLEMYRPLNPITDFNFKGITYSPSALTLNGKNNDDNTEQSPCTVNSDTPVTSAGIIKQFVEMSKSETSLSKEDMPLDFTKGTVKESLNTEEPKMEFNEDSNENKNSASPSLSSVDCAAECENNSEISKEDKDIKSEQFKVDETDSTSTNYSLCLLNDLTDLNNNSVSIESDTMAIKRKTKDSAFSSVKKTKARVKNWSCLKCANCLADDCGNCINCLDRPKFGGPFIRKQRCMMKKCLMKNFKIEKAN